MVAYRTYLRCFRSHYNVSAVTAFPNLNLTLFKYLSCFNIVKKCTISLFMMLLDCINSSELSCKLRKSFFFGCLSKAVVHICPLVLLTIFFSDKAMLYIYNLAMLVALPICTI